MFVLGSPSVQETWSNGCQYFSLSVFSEGLGICVTYEKLLAEFLFC